MTTYDVAVAGLGGFGSSAAMHLARRGLRVLGLDARPGGHDEGASHGESRIVRQAYFEGTAYVPLLFRTYELWEALGRDIGAPLVQRTGGLWMGVPGAGVFEGALASAREWDLEHDALEPAEVTKRFPAMSPPAGTMSLVEPNAGVVSPEHTVLSHLMLADRAGADLRHDEPLESWESHGDHVTVTTSRNTYDVGALVVAPGRWAPELLAPLGLPLTVRPGIMHWYAPPPDAPSFLPGDFPVWVWDGGSGAAAYGVPAMDGHTVKVALHWSEHRPVEDWTGDEIAGLVAPLMPGLGSHHVREVPCTYTMTPDEHFVVGPHPTDANVVLACGFSGHGFKFTPVLGEVLADLATGVAPAFDLSMFDPRRFTAPVASALEG